MATIQYPWQIGPVELVGHALEHLHSGTDSDRRIAFLLLDVGVETMFKVFLILPDEVSNALTSHTERRKATQGRFYVLVRGVAEALGPRLGEIDLNEVLYYHSVRNKLYHEGDGVTVSKENARRYAELAVALLESLLHVDLSDELRKPKIEAERKASSADKYRQVNRKQIEIARALAYLEADLHLAFGKIEPELVQPDFVESLRSIRHRYVRVGSIDLTPTQLSRFAEEVVEFCESAELCEEVENLLFLKMLTSTNNFVLEKEAIVNWLALEPDPTPRKLYLAIAELAMEGGIHYWESLVDAAAEFSEADFRADNRYDMENPDRLLELAEEHLATIRDMREAVRRWLDEHT